ncbi:MAG: hypothetical protein QNJ43_18310 [Breoghania sp.]|nr:hypothetical protein [Breoghania sp.]
MAAAPPHRPADRQRSDPERVAALNLAEGASVAARVDAALAAARSKAQKPVLSWSSLAGRIPVEVDPFARFAALPRPDEARMLSGDHSTRTSAFADLSHPDQRRLSALFARPPRLFSAGFERRIYGALRTDRFDGSAVVALSLVSND